MGLCMGAIGVELDMIADHACVDPLPPPPPVRPFHSQSSTGPSKPGVGGSSGLGSNPASASAKILAHHGNSHGEKEQKRDSALARLAK